MTRWIYDPDAGTDLATELVFEVQVPADETEAPAEFAGRTYAPGDELTVSLPKPIDRAALEEMAGAGGPWGWGGYTNQQLADLAAGRF